MTEIHRRRFLQLTGVASAAAALGCRVDAPRPGDTDDTDGVPVTPRAEPPDASWDGLGTPAGSAFPMGLQAGEPRADGALLWTRYTGAGALAVAVSTWDGAAWSEPRTLTATPADGGYVHVPVDGLPPDSWVAYQFEDDAGERSPVGTFVTAPDPGADVVVRFGAGSCFAQQHERFPVLEHVLGRGPLDFFLFLGDTAYFDGLADREDFRALWARNLTAPGFDVLLPAAAHVWTFDDHEVTNDFDPETLDPTLLATGFGAFSEALPVPVDEAGTWWRRLRFGRTVELFVTDARSDRRPSVGALLSESQLRWLLDGLTASDAVWKVVATSVPFADFTGTAWDFGVVTGDKWSGHPTERQRLLDAIEAAGVRGVLFVSGDVHCAFLGRVAASGVGAGIFEACCGPGGSMTNPLVRVLVDGDRFPWGQPVWNATRFELHPDGTAAITWVGEDDEDLAVARISVDGELLGLTAHDPATLGPPA